MKTEHLVIFNKSVFGRYTLAQQKLIEKGYGHSDESTNLVPVLISADGKKKAIFRMFDENKDLWAAHAVFVHTWELRC